MSETGGSAAQGGGGPQAAGAPPGKFLKLLLLLLTGVDFALVFVLYQQIFAQAEKSSADLAIIGGLILAVIATSAVIIKAYSGQYSTPSVIIPPDDRPLLEELIRNEKSKGVELYIQVASLKGPTRAATALGLTGLPLATIGLTIFFSVIALFSDGSFLDLAKLTLGAFIGSFVQRSNEAIERAVRAGGPEAGGGQPPAGGAGPGAAPGSGNPAPEAESPLPPGGSPWPGGTPPAGNP